MKALHHVAHQLAEELERIHDLKYYFSDCEKVDIQKLYLQLSPKRN